MPVVVIEFPPVMPLSVEGVLADLSRLLGTYTPASGS